MNKSMLSIATAAMLLAGAGVASAQTATTTTTNTEWTKDQGTTFSEYSTTKKYGSVTDPSLKPTIGMELPGTVTLYRCPIR